MGQLTCTVTVGSSVDLQGGTGKFKKGFKKNMSKAIAEEKTVVVSLSWLVDFDVIVARRP
jgi:hypothetical protein